MCSSMKRIGAASLLFIASLGISSIGLAADPTKSESYLNDAKESIAKRDYKKALIQLKNAVQADPDNAAARYQLGLAQFRAGDAASAEKELRIARERSYPEEQIAIPLAEAYMIQQKFDLLLSDIPEGNRPNDVESEVRFHRGLALLSLKRLPEAERTLSSGLDKAQRPAQLLTALARVKAAANDVAAAKELVARALESDPQYAEGWAIQGKLKVLSRDFDGGREDYDRALEIEQTNQTARTARAQLLVEQNQIALAESDVNLVLATNPSNGIALYLRALIFARQKDYRQAELALQKLGPMLKTYPPALFLLAGINLEQGQLAQAEDNINRYRTEVPEDPNGVIFLSDLLLKRDSPQRAIAVLNAALEKNANNVQMLALLSDAYLKNKQPDESARTLDRIAELAKDNAAALTQIATFRLQMGRPAEAVRDLEAAVHANPNAVRTKLLLVLGYLNEGKLDEARKLATELREQYRDNPLVEVVLGIVAVNKGAWPAAREHLEAALKINPDFVPAKINLAKVAVAEKNGDEARRLYDEVLKIDAKNESALLGEADLSLLESKLDDAILWLEKARNLGPRSIPPRVRLVEAYLAKRDSAKAVEIGRELVTVGAGDVAALRTAARAFVAANDTPDTITTLKRVIELEPTSSKGHYDLAHAFSMAKDSSNARAELERALELDPADLNAQKSYVSVITSSQNLQSGLSFARKLGEARAKEWTPDLLMGDLLAAAGRREAAISAYEEGRAKEDAPLLMARIAGIQTGMGKASEAMKLYESWLAKHPDDFLVRFLLASLLMMEKNYDRSLVEHKRLLEARPDDPIVLNNIAYLYDQMGDAKSLEFAEKAHQIAPDSPNVSDTLGWILVRMSAAQRALPILEKAVVNAPGQGDLQYHYAVALKDTGNSEAAKDVLERLIKSGSMTSDPAGVKKLLDQLKAKR
jgi:putative PEP-CTERM system TPR-repeat lipoprotein